MRTANCLRLASAFFWSRSTLSRSSRIRENRSCSHKCVRDHVDVVMRCDDRDRERFVKIRIPHFMRAREYRYVYVACLLIETNCVKSPAFRTNPIEKTSRNSIQSAGRANNGHAPKTVDKRNDTRHSEHKNGLSTTASIPPQTTRRN